MSNWVDGVKFDEKGKTVGEGHGESVWLIQRRRRHIPWAVSEAEPWTNITDACSLFERLSPDSTKSGRDKR